MSTQTHDLQSIRRLIREHLPDLQKRFAVESLSVFGSVIHGEQRPGSDVDLLVTFHRVPGLIRFVQLENELTDLLGCKVDLVLRDALKPVIGERILREAVPI